MYVGCSEIGVSVLVKHVQHVRIIRVFCLPGGLNFSVPGWTEPGGIKFFSVWEAEKLLDLLEGISTQADNMDSV